MGRLSEVREEWKWVNDSRRGGEEEIWSEKG
jgi:hypothetical protein